ncbi:hypothetical protein AAKU55_001102 [Oxalobacteraceae bacterium GrIS 1.11]
MKRTAPADLSRRRALQAMCALPLSLLGGCAAIPPLLPPLAETHPMHDPKLEHDGSRDFDFLAGPWLIDNRRLLKRLQDNHEWESFDATMHNQALPGGIGNYDDFIAEQWRPGFVGMSLRLFNPQTRLWSIYWLDNKTAGLNGAGTLLPPVVGKFEHGIGVFECDDELDDKPIRVRYTWSDITPDSACWEQAMSPDQGKTWEMNWHMRMRKVV